MMKHRMPPPPPPTHLHLLKVGLVWQLKNSIEVGVGEQMDARGRHPCDVRFGFFVLFLQDSPFGLDVCACAAVSSSIVVVGVM